MREMSVDHLETFKTAGLPKKMRTTTKATTFAKIRCFLRAAFRRGWIKEALVDKVTTVKAVYNQKEPYTDEEVRAIFDHAQELDGGINSKNGLRLIKPAYRLCSVDFFRPLQLDDISISRRQRGVNVTETYYTKRLDGRCGLLKRLVSELLVNARGDAFGNREGSVLTLTRAIVGNPNYVSLTSEYPRDGLLRQPPQTSEVFHAVMSLKCEAFHLG